MSDKEDFGDALEKLVEENRILKKEIEDCEKLIRALSKKNIALKNKLEGRP